MKAKTDAAEKIFQCNRCADGLIRPYENMPLLLRFLLLFGFLLLVNGPSVPAQEGNALISPLQTVLPRTASSNGFYGAGAGSPLPPRVPSRRPEFTLVVESEPSMSAIPQGGRQSFFQGINAEATWLPAFGDDGLGMTRVRLGATAALPLPTKNRPLLISPSFGVDFLSLKEKDRFDVSKTLYGAGLNLLWMTPLGSKTLFTLGASPSWSSDFRQDSGDALRVPVNFGLTWLCNPRTRIMIGAAYLDRSDYPWIPFVGLTWTPTADWQVELGVPRTRISRRIACDPAPGGSQRGGDWVYLGGDFGGGTWAVERGDGVNDILMYSDYRILVGFERRRPGSLTWGFEIGCVFGREMEYDSGHGKFSPEETLFLRLRTSY